MVPAGELQDYLAQKPFELDDAGAPQTPMAFVDLDAAPSSSWRALDAVDSVARSGRVLVGVSRHGVDIRLQPLLEALTCTLIAGEAADDIACVAVGDVDGTCARIANVVDAVPRAALAMEGLLRAVPRMPVADGLLTESCAYSMLLAGPEFAAWRGRVPRGNAKRPSRPPLEVQRSANVLDIVLDRPERHNAFGRDTRDALVDALDAALADDTVSVRLSGRGPSFCSGGDLDEFGDAPDPVTAHLVRTERSAAMRVHRCRERIEARLHGACIGAGIEIPSFAGRVIAAEDAWFQLPELSMGLVPGAGGTVGITARIGRWRTAWLLLTGERLDARRALVWGLVDAVRPERSP